MRDVLHGHLWTVGPHIRNVVTPAPRTLDGPWSTTIEDPTLGTLTLTGRLYDHPGSDTVTVIVHGLGGSAESRYMLAAGDACRRAGLSYLRLNLRGADRRGDDLYHAAMTPDIRGALASSALARFRRVYLLGYSMGGHISLRWAGEPDQDPRVRAVASVCAPLDLTRAAQLIGRPLGRPYQRHVLNGLKQMYVAAAAKHPMPVPVEKALSLRNILEWDSAIVVPRFGFGSSERYYASASAGPLLEGVDVPTLFVGAERDPVVTAEPCRRWLAKASDAVQVRWSRRGGHVAFPRDLDLGFGDVGPLERQIVRWLCRHR